jgi:hypothetical protein
VRFVLRRAGWPALGEGNFQPVPYTPFLSAAGPSLAPDGRPARELPLLFFTTVFFCCKTRRAAVLALRNGLENPSHFCLCCATM